MRIKLIAILLTSVISSGCASTSDKVAKDFFDGANSNAKSRQLEEANSVYSKKRDYKNEAIEDSMSGVLTALFRGIFSSGKASDNSY
ncbi:MAG: hypothetical protein CL578_09310 [Alteromonadaceae bacterium]|uniref:Lipoprotein n=2 Tax=Paraglaciecola TaxID=1621534 RepID=A0A857JEN8_9ALTE|nr:MULTISPECIES: hypothetical protein [Paraglaciecola]MBN25236.1 hypothetical protein [Alteromonadaceae bacterium]QHJ10485.1 hypothetical protein FX988_00699 [Paraglaciecola mesophila]GAC07106.1 hypothetical protein GAGA_4279 [Paraglaciecola agarilytica NO2]|tara:strand:- start:3477 stop:3737 length:261 start_codon:yes stop_codon:yes gene_type:complete